MKRFFDILVLVFTISGFTFGQSAWEWVNPKPQGFDLNDVAFLNSTTAIAVGDQGLVMKTTDGGISWSTQYLPVDASADIFGIDFWDQYLGAVVGEKGLFYLTTDGGSTWTHKDLGVVNHLRSVLFINGTTLVAVGSTGYVPTAQILYSSDLGTTWQYWQYSKSVYGVAFSEPLKGVAVGNSGFMAITTDGGVTWDSTRFNTGYALRRVYFSSSSRGWAVGSSWNNYFYTPIVLRTFDGGGTWSVVGLSYDSLNLSDVYFKDDNVGFIIANNGEVLRTANGGFSWTKERVTDFSLDAVAVTPSGAGIIVGGDGVNLHTSNFGANWQQNYFSLQSPQEDLRDFCVVNPIQAWFLTNKSIIKSTDLGESWQRDVLPDSIIYYFIDFSDENSGIITGMHIKPDSAGARVLVTDNGGASWQLKGPNRSLLIQYVNGIDMTNNRVGYLIGRRYTRRWSPFYYRYIVVNVSDFVLQTIDGGVTWEFSMIDTTQNGNMKGVSASGDFVIAYTDTVLYTSSNAGQSWTRKTFSDLGTEYRIMKCQALPEGTAFMVMANAGAVYFLKSTNFGQDWEPRYLFAASSPISSLDALAFYDTSFGMVLGFSYIAATSDGGMSWVEQVQRPNYGLSQVAFVDRNIGLAISSSGILKTTTGGITAVGNGEGQPSGFTLYQNYPNPFNPTTAISYSLPQTDWVTIRVYNLLGSEVATLVDEKKNPGNYQVTWNGERFSSGVYFYKLTTGADISVKKMVLLK